jgi:hypothetical protein
MVMTAAPLAVGKASPGAPGRTLDRVVVERPGGGGEHDS